MATKAAATIRLKFESEKSLTALLAALGPEAKTPSTRRADVKLEKEDLYLVLAVEADDAVALRSTLNAYLRWVASTLNVIASLEQ